MGTSVGILVFVDLKDSPAKIGTGDLLILWIGIVDTFESQRYMIRILICPLFRSPGIWRRQYLFRSQVSTEHLIHKIPAFIWQFIWSTWSGTGHAKNWILVVFFAKPNLGLNLNQPKSSKGSSIGSTKARRPRCSPRANPIKLFTP